MSKTAISRQRSLECTPVRRRSGTSPEGELVCSEKVLDGRMCYTYIMYMYMHMCIAEHLQSTNSKDCHLFPCVL